MSFSRRIPALRWLTLTFPAALVLLSISSQAQSPYFPNTQPATNPYAIGRSGIISYGVDHIPTISRFGNNTVTRSTGTPLGFRPPPPWLAQQLSTSPAANRARGIYDSPFSPSSESPNGYGR